MSAEFFVPLHPPKHLDDRRFFNADMVISYLTIRMTEEGDRVLLGQGEIRGPLWTARGWLSLKLRIDEIDFMATDPVRTEDNTELLGWTISISPLLGQRLGAQEIIGADLGQGILLRQVRILPSSKANNI